MDIAAHIRILLYKHNCVVIPSFGAILLHYAPAQIHPTLSQFTPPHKAITFNKSLTINDGLLVSSVANALQKHYNDAEKFVEQFANDLKNSLKTKGDYVLQSVGKFKVDIEGCIVFEAFDDTNYLTDAFGMEHFISPTIMRREAFQPQDAKPLLKHKKKFNWFGLGLFFVVLFLITYQLLNIFRVLPTHENASLLSDSQSIRNKAIELNEAMHKNDTQANHHDTVVHLIVIRDETSESIKNETTLDKLQPITSEASSVNELNSLSSMQPTKRTRDSILYSSNTKYPLASEYNPSKWGAYLIVFSKHRSEEAALQKHKQLINERIGVRIYFNGTEYMVVKSGYMSKQAAAKDVALYSLLGYDNTWLYKMPEQ